MNRLCFVVPWLLMGCGGGKSSESDRATSETQATPYTFPYALNAPADAVTLPKRLREVSGLTYYKDNKLLCIQDEEAAVFVYDIEKKQITQEVGFGGYGDFEGIEYVNGDVYALESDGNLQRFTLDLSSPKSVQVARIPTDLPAKTEVEGLGYDPKTERLLIAVKKGGGTSSSRAVYSFGLRSRAVYREMQLPEETLRSAGVDPDEFKPSALAVHPETGDWYVLSSASHQLIVTNGQKQVLHVEKLDKKQLPQPEGICFAPNGDLFIASEGKGKSGYLLRFGSR
ncbi:MAG: SdiA-regulated domain-containing protein [Spirosoma sp.]|nr:SdiA-regulated domain-containing protein [Spirosoma sp.]